MNSFEKFCSGLSCTRKEYLEACEYYKTANDKDKRKFKLYQQKLGKILIDAIEESDDKVRIICKFHGIYEDDVENFIMAYLLSVLTAFDLKNIYERVLNNLFGKTIYQIASEYHISDGMLLKLMHYYEVHYLKMDEKYNGVKAKMCFYNFINYSVRTKEEYDLAISYYSIASDVEKYYFDLTRYNLGYQVYLGFVNKTESIYYLACSKHMELSILKDCFFFTKGKLNDEEKIRLEDALKEEKERKKVINDFVDEQMALIREEQKR